MIFEEFLTNYHPLLAKIARTHGLAPGDIPGLAYLAWHEASESYRADAGASFSTWSARRFEALCLRERAQGRHGLALDGDNPLPEAALARLSVSEDAAIFDVLEPEPELEVAERSFFGLHGRIIDAALDGSNIAQIAERAGVTPRRVNQIIAEMTQKRSISHQADLFGLNHLV